MSGCKDLVTAERAADTRPAAPLRAATIADLGTLVELDRTCFGSRAWSAGAWREVVRDPAFVTLLLPTPAGAAGAVVLLPWPPVAVLASLAVHPRERRRGLGRRLVREAVARARLATARWISLEVDADNPAVGLYRREGFGVTRRFRDEGRRRLEMLRRLGGQRG